MADIPQVIATYDALVGVALGAGLAYVTGPRLLVQLL